jgi:magnesium transporter
VLYALMDAVVDRYFPLLDSLETELETHRGSQIFVRGAARQNIQRLYALKRKPRQLRHAVSPPVGGLGKLHGGRVPAVCAAARSTSGTSATTWRASMRHRRHPRHHRHGHPGQPVDGDHRGSPRPPSAWRPGPRSLRWRPRFAGIWGMNFEHMPELKWKWGYPMALAAIARRQQASCSGASGAQAGSRDIVKP